MGTNGTHRRMLTSVIAVATFVATVVADGTLMMPESGAELIYTKDSTLKNELKIRWTDDEPAGSPVEIAVIGGTGIATFPLAKLAPDFKGENALTNARVTGQTYSEYTVQMVYNVSYDVGVAKANQNIVDLLEQMTTQENAQLKVRIHAKGPFSCDVCNPDTELTVPIKFKPENRCVFESNCARLGPPEAVQCTASTPTELQCTCAPLFSPTGPMGTCVSNDGGTTNGNVNPTSGVVDTNSNAPASGTTVQDTTTDASSIALSLCLIVAVLATHV